jgi:WhiB family redox-sensing transcriptional regulator
VWKPANSIDWQRDALCSRKEHQKNREWFFSKIPRERYDAKNICFSCPVRRQCIQWALEHRQIWGVWGGKDEMEIRRALSVSHNGEEARRRRYPNCPYCGARPSKLETSSQDMPGGGRWTVAKIVTCTTCHFAWRSRTSVNAVEAYKQDKPHKLEKRLREKEKRSKKKSSAKTKLPRKTSSLTEDVRPQGQSQQPS